MLQVVGWTRENPGWSLEDYNTALGKNKKCGARLIKGPQPPVVAP